MLCKPDSFIKMTSIHFMSTKPKCLFSSGWLKVELVPNVFSRLNCYLSLPNATIWIPDQKQINPSLVSENFHFKFLGLSLTLLYTPNQIKIHFCLPLCKDIINYSCLPCKSLMRCSRRLGINIQPPHIRCIFILAIVFSCSDIRV